MTKEDILLELIRYGLPAISVLGGAFIGGLFSSRVPNKQFLQQSEREDMKEKRNTEMLKIETYNRILKLDGENMVITGGICPTFNLTEYSRYIRPVLYGKFHLLDQLVAVYCIKIDETLKECDINEEIVDSDHEHLCTHYNLLVNEIKNHYPSLQNT